MPEIFKAAYYAGLGFTAGVIVFLSIYLVFVKVLSWVYDLLVKKIKTKPVTKKEAPKEEPHPTTDTARVSINPKEHMHKDLTFGSLVFHPDYAVSESDPKMNESEYSVVYKTDKGSQAILTVRLTLPELMSLKQ